MQELILRIMDNYGYIGIFLLITIENIFPPIPSEVVLTFGGFMTTYSAMHVWGVILSSTAGSVLGAVVLYVIGRVLHTERLERLFDGRIGKLLHLRKEDVRRAERWFVKRGYKAVFFCRFVPIVRSIISIPAGVSRMKVLPFLGLTAVGTFVWNTALVYIGKAAGSAWSTIAHYVDIYAMIAAAVIIVAVLCFGAVFIKKRFLNNPTDGE